MPSQYESPSGKTCGSGVHVSIPFPSRIGHGFVEFAAGSPALGYHQESNMKYLIGILRAARSALTCSMVFSMVLPGAHSRGQGQAFCAPPPPQHSEHK